MTINSRMWDEHLLHHSYFVSVSEVGDVMCTHLTSLLVLHHTVVYALVQQRAQLDEAEALGDDDIGAAVAKIHSAAAVFGEVVASFQGVHLNGLYNLGICSRAGAVFQLVHFHLHQVAPLPLWLDSSTKTAHVTAALFGGRAKR
jgi:hypothetical protein